MRTFHLSQSSRRYSLPTVDALRPSSPPNVLPDICTFVIVWLTMRCNFEDRILLCSRNL
jgi:hypothetical protein